MKPVKIMTALVGLVLSGCAGNPAPVTQRVEVPVSVSCIAADALPVKPAYQFDKLPAAASDGAKVIALANDWLVGRKYEGLMEGLIAGCR